MTEQLKQAAQAALNACERIVDQEESPVQLGIDFRALGSSLRRALTTSQQAPTSQDLERAAKMCDGFAAPDMAAALRGQPAQAGDVEQNILSDSAWIAGAKFGWNCGVEGTRDLLNQCIAQRIKDRVQARASLPTQPAAQATPEPVAWAPLKRSADGRAAVLKFFMFKLKRHDFLDYITNTLAADFACVLGGYLQAMNTAATPEPGVIGASTWFALAMEAAASLEDASYCMQDSEAKAAAIGAARYVRDRSKAMLAATQQAAGEPTFAQLRQILDGLGRLYDRDSKAEFLRVWIRDWTQHKLGQATSPQQAAGEPVGEPVAWRDPTNTNPAQGCTYDKAVHLKWPHIFSQPLFTRPAPGVPEGFALVQSPITEAMHEAACKVLIRSTGMDGLPQRMLDALAAAQAKGGAA